MHSIITRIHREKKRGSNISDINCIWGFTYYLRVSCFVVSNGISNASCLCREHMSVMVRLFQAEDFCNVICQSVLGHKDAALNFWIIEKPISTIGVIQILFMHSCQDKIFIKNTFFFIIIQKISYLVCVYLTVCVLLLYVFHQGRSNKFQNFIL